MDGEIIHRELSDIFTRVGVDWDVFMRGINELAEIVKQKTYKKKYEIHFIYIDFHPIVSIWTI